MNITETQYDKALAHAFTLLDKLPNDLRYHAKPHTVESVVPAGLKLAKVEGLSENSTRIVGVTLAFHDVGYLEQYEKNEPVAARIANEYLASIGVDVMTRELIADAILTTDPGLEPNSYLGKISKDADLNSLGGTDFFEWGGKLREEALLHPDSAMYERAVTDEVWNKGQLGFVNEFHKWYTSGAAEIYEPQKQRNVAELRKLVG